MKKTKNLRIYPKFPCAKNFKMIFDYCKSLEQLYVCNQTLCLTKSITIKSMEVPSVIFDENLKWSSHIDKVKKGQHYFESSAYKVEEIQK